MNDQKVALITGSNKGIGFETARVLLARSYRVFVAVRNHDRGKVAVRHLGEGAELLLLDVADSDSIQRAAREVTQAMNRLDLLVNNAGIYEDEGINILKVPRGAVRKTFETNAFGALEVIQAFLPLLKQTEGSRVINVSSGYGALDGMSPDVPSYCLSKLALNGITKLVSKALAFEGIPVNSVCPGWVRTDMGGANASRSVSEGADSIVWLATEAPLTLTGKFLRDREVIPW